MIDDTQELKAKIAKLEEEMAKDHFGGLVDKGRADKDYKRLKKLKKELKKLEGGK